MPGALDAANNKPTGPSGGGGGALGGSGSAPKGKGGGMLGQIAPSKAGSKKKDEKKGFLAQIGEAVVGVGTGIARLPGILYNEAKAGHAGGGVVGALGRSGGSITEAVNPVSKTNLDFARQNQPLSYEMVASPVRTVREIPDTAVALRPGGPGFGQSMLGKEIRDKGYLSTVLGKAADVSMVAGGVGALGKAAGAGRLAKAADLEATAGAASRAAGLGKTAQSEGLLREGLKASGAGNVTKGEDMLRAAKQLENAKGLRAEVAESGKLVRGAEKVTEGAQSISRFGATVANAPAKPYELAARGLGKGVSALAGSEKVGAAVTRATGLAERAGNTKRVADSYHRLVAAPTQEALYRHVEKGESIAAVTEHLKAQFPKLAPVFDRFESETAARAAAFRKAAPVTPEAPNAWQRVEGPPVDRAAEVKQFERQTTKVLHEGLRDELSTSFGKQAGNVFDPNNARSVGQQIHEAGYVAWDPKTGLRVPEEKIVPTTVVVPRGVYHSAKLYSTGAGATPSLPLRVYDKATSAWKHSVLALSPAWHYGNIVGNVVMAGIGGGLTPPEMLRYGREAISLAKKGDIPPEIASRGYAFSERALTTGPVPKGVKGKLRHPIQTSYAFNEAVDGVGRTMIYLAKQGKGFSSEAALKMALDAMGDYSRMTQFERNVVRRVIPFYAWQKHITKLAFRLPLEHPARVAWTLHLADNVKEIVPDEGAEGFNRNTIPAPGFLGGADNRLGVGQLNPFGSPFLVDPTLRGAGFQLNPLIKAGTVAATGLNPNRGFQPVRTPESKFGEAPRPLIQDPVRFGQYLSQIPRQTRQIQDLVAGETKTRLDTGQEAKKQYPETAQDRKQQLLKILGPNVRPAEK